MTDARDLLRGAAPPHSPPEMTVIIARTRQLRRRQQFTRLTAALVGGLAATTLVISALPDGRDALVVGPAAASPAPTSPAAASTVVSSRTTLEVETTAIAPVIAFIEAPCVRPILSVGTAAGQGRGPDVEGMPADPPMDDSGSIPGGGIG